MSSPQVGSPSQDGCGWRGSPWRWEQQPVCEGPVLRACFAVSFRDVIARWLSESQSVDFLLPRGALLGFGVRDELSRLQMVKPQDTGQFGH